MFQMPHLLLKRLERLLSLCIWRTLCVFQLQGQNLMGTA